MFLQTLNLHNFKNYTEATLHFDQPICCFLGNNGSGKTNLLDAMHYLSMTKSAINPADAQNVQLGEAQFMIRGEFLFENKIREVACSYQSGLKKVIREDGFDYTKFSEHIGKYPLVLIAPQDIELIWDGSEVRRKFFDSLLSQVNPSYLANLITYTSHLKQRNSSLKLFAQQGRVDNDLLWSYDQKLIPSATFIYNDRKKLITEYLSFFRQYYRHLSEWKEEVHIQYDSDLENRNFEEILLQNRSRDLAGERTLAGIHRDDFQFLLNGQEVKRYGSQGQQKSFLIALKLAEFQMIADIKKFKPLLLLDDIFDKLDDFRIQKILQLVSNGTFGQLFITDARAGRCQEALKQAGIKAKLVFIENGMFTVN
ncbi:MAG: DNA replication and repair protein RecF [Bacteroidetes bacterium]|nr:DNA replication and repair protein RecF [Bacteroidota bacterium]